MHQVIERRSKATIPKLGGAIITDLPAGGFVRRLRITKFRATFALAVILPTVVAFIYFAFIATPEYVSEAQIAVRSNTGQALGRTSISGGNTAPMGSQTLSGGLHSVDQDAFIVIDYIISSTIIEDIGGKPTIQKIYSRPDIDWLARLDPSEPLEEIRNYWRSKIVVNIDTISSIVTLKVRAFSPTDAQSLTQTIIKHSEALVNAISERNRRDTMRRAEEELQSARKRLRNAQNALLDFRNKNNLVNPMASATSIGGMIAELTQQKISLENNRAAMLGVVTDESPVKRAINAQIDAIDQQIAKLKSQLASPSKNNPISDLIATYDSLQFDEQFAQGLYSISQSAYENARLQTETQQLYIITIVRPTLPEDVSYPRVVAYTALTFMVFLILWSMVVLLVASVRDHVG
jgi:capsular polysaccharide transport system permease protein